MTIQSTASRATYAGDNVSTVFPVPWLFFANVDVTAIKTTAAGVLTTLTLNVDYTLTGAGVPAGGTLTKTTALLTGETLAIFLDPPRTQLSHYLTNDIFPAATLETNLDREVQISQRLYDLVTRAIRAPDGDAAPGMSLPGAVARANLMLTFDGNGNVLLAPQPIAGSISQTGIGQLLYPRTAAESAALVTPANYAFPGGNLIGQGNVFRYGAKGDNATDDSAAFLKAQQSNFTFSVPPATGYLTNTALTGTYSFIAVGNPAFSGSNPVLAWSPAFGGILQVVSTGTYNGIVSRVRNILAANTVAQPTAITGYGRNDNGGNIAFGLFGRADQYATTGVVSNEVDSFNWSGVAASSNLPPNRGYSTPQNIPVAFTVAAGGNASSAIGIQIVPEGGNPQQFITGIYMNWQTCTTYGLLIDALLNDTMTTAVLKHSTNQTALSLIGSGAIFGVAIAGAAGQFTCGATNLAVGMQVKVSGALTGSGTITGYANPTTYVISATNNSTTFTLQTLVGGAIVTTAGTTTGLSFTATAIGGAAILYTDANGVVQYKVTQIGTTVVGGNQVLAGRIGGYGTPTGNAYQPSFAAGSITLPNLAAAFAQLVLDLKTHGMIGT